MVSMEELEKHMEEYPYCFVTGHQLALTKCRPERVSQMEAVGDFISVPDPETDSYWWYFKTEEGHDAFVAFVDSLK